MSEKSNSARRLLKILSAIKKSNNRKPGVEVLSELFPDLAQKTSSIRVYAEIINLASEVREDISSHMETESFVKNADEVLVAFAEYQVDAQIRQLQGGIKDVSIRGLEMCADYLDKHRPEKVLSESDLEKLRKAVRGLMDEVVSSDIDARLKQFMLDKLGNIEQAISLYEFHGISPIERSLQEAVGGGALKEHSDKENECFKKEIWGNFKKVIGGALVIMAAINTTDTFIENLGEARCWLSGADSGHFPQSPSLPGNETSKEVEE